MDSEIEKHPYEDPFLTGVDLWEERRRRWITPKNESEKVKVDLSDNSDINEKDKDNTNNNENKSNIKNNHNKNTSSSHDEISTDEKGASLASMEREISNEGYVRLYDLFISEGRPLRNPIPLLFAYKIIVSGWKAYDMWPPKSEEVPTTVKGR